MALLIQIHGAALAPPQGRESSEIHYPKSSPKSPREFASTSGASSNTSSSNANSNIYRTGPKFTSGHSTVMVYMIVCLLGGSIAMRTLLVRENKKRLTGQSDHWTRGMSHREAVKLGDKRPDFIYTLRFYF